MMMTDQGSQLSTERKFLLKNLPKLKWDESMYIQQFYEGPQDCYREVFYYTPAKFLAKKEYYHLHKVRVDGWSQLITPTLISEKEFTDKLSTQNQLRIISKWRHTHTVNDLKFEVDVFDEMSLIVAEVEVPHHRYNLALPQEIKDELICDVTLGESFSNYNLATLKNL